MKYRTTFKPIKKEINLIYIIRDNGCFLVTKEQYDKIRTFERLVLDGEV